MMRDGKVIMYIIIQLIVRSNIPDRSRRAVQYKRFKCFWPFVEIPGFV